MEKINNVKSLLDQIIDTIEKINSVEHLLKLLLKPIHLSTSEDPIIKRLASKILEIQQDQFNYFIENKMELERMERNAEDAYRETHDNSYLEIIIHIKNVITHANLTYDNTQIPLEIRFPNQNYNQNFCKNCFKDIEPLTKQISP